MSYLALPSRYDDYAGTHRVEILSGNDAGLRQVVWRHLHFDAVADGEAHPTLAHLAADRRQHEVFVIQLDAEHGSREHSLDSAFYFDWFFFHALLC